jgi:WD40 repeat protein
LRGFNEFFHGSTEGPALVGSGCLSRDRLAIQNSGENAMLGAGNQRERIDESQEFSASARVGRVGVARVGLISLRGIGLIAVGLAALAWFSDGEPRRDLSHRQVLSGEQGGGNRSLAVSPDGTSMATTNTFGHLALWRLDDGWWTDHLLETGLFAKTAAFSPDGHFLAIGGTHLVLWELGSQGGKPVARLPVAGIESLAFSPDGKTLAFTFQKSRKIVLWDLVAGQERASFPIDSPFTSVLSLDFSPDGRYLAAGANDRPALISVWNLTTGQRVLKLNGNCGPTKSVAFSPDGTSLATAFAYERFVRLWDPRSGQLLRVFGGHEFGTNSVAFSPDGTSLATAGNDGIVRVWTVATGELRTVLDGDAAALPHVAFSPDGRVIAMTGIGDNDVRLWYITEQSQGQGPGGRHDDHLSHHTASAVQVTNHATATSRDWPDETAAFLGVSGPMRTADFHGARSLPFTPL